MLIATHEPVYTVQTKRLLHSLKPLRIIGANPFADTEPESGSFYLTNESATTRAESADTLTTLAGALTSDFRNPRGVASKRIGSCAFCVGVQESLST
jgi:hypothetical protein